MNFDDPSTQSPQQMIVVGAFPPPMHGLANANAQMADRFQAAGFAVRRCNTAATVPRGPLAHLQRLVRVLGAVGVIVNSKFIARFPHHVVYIGANAGGGRLFDVILAAAARCCKLRFVVHHHSYRYVRRRQALTALFVTVAGPDATHVLLCDEMKTLFMTHYRVPENRVVVVSSVVLAEPATRTVRPMARRRLAVIGYLGAVSKEKGITHFIATLDRLDGRVDAAVAGPIAPNQRRDTYSAALSEFPRATYWGEVAGERKVEFLQAIDVLLFPSTYPHEADPLVVHEAQAYGVPVIATRIGCVRPVSGSTGVKLVSDAQHFAPEAAQMIGEWLEDGDEYQRVAASAARAFKDQLRAGEQALRTLLASLTVAE